MNFLKDLGLTFLALFGLLLWGASWSIVPCIIPEIPKHYHNDFLFLLSIPLGLTLSYIAFYTGGRTAYWAVNKMNEEDKKKEMEEKKNGYAEGWPVWRE